MDFAKSITKYNDKYLNSIAVLALDVLISFMSSIGIILTSNVLPIRFDILTLNEKIIWVAVSLLSTIFAFYIFKTYKIVIRHMKIKDISKFILAIGVKIIALIVVIGYFLDSSKIFYAAVVAVFDGLLTFCVCMLARVFMILVYDRITSLHNSTRKMKVLIAGTNEKAVALVTRLHSSAKYEVLGFLKNGSKQQSNFQIMGLNVFKYDGVKSLTYYRKRYGLEAIIIPSESYIEKYKNSIVEDAHKSSIKLLITPTIDEAVNGVVLHNHIRQVKIEDLLGRDQISISKENIRDYCKDKVVMVTGGAGSIGSELCRQLATFDIKELVIFDNAETPTHYLRLELEDRFPNLKFTPVIGDVRLKERLDYVFRDFKPNIVFHAAAYKHVPLMESNPCEAIMVNVVGSKNVADKCLEYGVEKMVMISTDKAVNPTNVMGCSKRLAEIYVQSLGVAVEKGAIQGTTKFVTTRFGNVLGSNGSVIPRFRDQIEKGGPVTVTDPRIIRFFMTIPEASLLVMEAASFSTGNQIFVFDMGEPVRIDDLARNMIRLAGLEPDKDIKIEYTGLRPGEKLYEEVLSNKENTLDTPHQKIKIANVRKYEYPDICQSIEQLHSLATSVQIDEMVRTMKQIVPEFISNNSKFEVFDKKN